MIPAASLQRFGTFATFLGQVVKRVATQSNIPDAFRDVRHADGQAPGTPRLVRLRSHEEGRAASTFKAGIDPSLAHRHASLSERAADRWRRSPKDVHASDNPTPPGHRDMVVQKATVLAKDYLRATRSGGPSSSVSRQAIAPSCGKEARRHIREALRNLQSELTNTMYLFEGSQKGHAARCLREQVVHELHKHGPDQALRAASNGIADVRLASARLIPKAIVLPPAHFFPESPVSRERVDDDWIQTSSRSSSLPSVGSDSVFEEHEITAASAVTMSKGASASISSHFAPGTASLHSKPDDALSTRGLEEPINHVDYVRKLRKIQNELFRIASKYPGTERGTTARDLHSATQRTFEVVDAKTAWSGANNLLPAIRSMSKSAGFG
jgi:hypothetical protein